MSALPLWWAGGLVPEGWDRARRLGGFFWSVHLTHPAVGETILLGEMLKVDRLASRVVLLDLVDGRLVERAP